MGRRTVGVTHQDTLVAKLLASALGWVREQALQAVTSRGSQQLDLSTTSRHERQIADPACAGVACVPLSEGLSCAAGVRDRPDPLCGFCGTSCAVADEALTGWRDFVEVCAGGSGRS